MRTYLIWATGYSCYVLGQMHGKGHTHWKNALVALAVGALWPAAVCSRHVHSMDRLARNLEDLRRVVSDLTGKGVSVRFEKEGLTFAPDQSNPMADLLLNLLGAVAQFERALILERQREGIEQAKRAGKYKGRKPVLAPDDLAKAKEMIGLGIPVARVARNFDIGRTTLYRHIAGMGKAPEGAPVTSA